MKFVIEHLEPKVWEWCVLEYNHIKKIVGKDNAMFTNVKRNQRALQGCGEIKSTSVKRMCLKRSCLLDPSAKQTLTTADAKRFDYFVFGGILGDAPMQYRTKDMLPAKYFTARRNIGAFQFSTDTAVYVTKKILDGGSLNKFSCQDDIEIPLGKGESVILPFRYVLIDGKPLLPSGLIKMIKRKKMF